MAKSNSTKTVGTAAALAAAAAAAAAGAYWLYGAKHAAQHRRQAKSWMLKARGEVLEALEKLRDIDKATYLEIVDQVMRRYKGLGVSSKELSQMARDLKASWIHMQTAGAKGKRAAKTGRKVAKKVKRKISRK